MPKANSDIKSSSAESTRSVKKVRSFSQFFHSEFLFDSCSFSRCFCFLFLSQSIEIEIKDLASIL